MRPIIALVLGTLLLTAPSVRGASETPKATPVEPTMTTNAPAAARVETTLSGPEDVARVVADVERAFARTMADRDLDAFASYLHPDTVWFSGPGGSALHGSDAVVAAWRGFFEGPQAPFAWAPDRVAVMPDGKLAMSMGPVFDLQGQPIARFTSVWQRGEDGRWLILFDKGEALPPAAPAKTD